MTLMPDAEQHHSPNFSSPVRRPPRGIVIHTVVGSYESAIGWQSNPASQVSSYFVNAQDGRLAQMVDLAYKAWTQGAGNVDWVGIENEGNPDVPLTSKQLDNIAKIFVFLTKTFGYIPVQVTDDPINGFGIGWHGMGAAVGWGHPSCPGEIIKAQRPEMVRRINAILHPPAPAPQPQEHEMLATTVAGGTDARPFTAELDPVTKTMVLFNGLAVAGDHATAYGVRMVSVPTGTATPILVERFGTGVRVVDSVGHGFVYPKR